MGPEREVIGAKCLACGGKLALPSDPLSLLSQIKMLMGQLKEDFPERAAVDSSVEANEAQQALEKNERTVASLDKQISDAQARYPELAAKVADLPPPPQAAELQGHMSDFDSALASGDLEAIREGWAKLKPSCETFAQGPQPASGAGGAAADEGDASAKGRGAWKPHAERKGAEPPGTLIPPAASAYLLSRPGREGVAWPRAVPAAVPARGGSPRPASPAAERRMAAAEGPAAATPAGGGAPAAAEPGEAEAARPLAAAAGPAESAADDEGARPGKRPRVLDARAECQAGRPLGGPRTSAAAAARAGCGATPSAPSAGGHPGANRVRLRGHAE
ncbi:unnamed protein product [Prorocentrum cordatum]|uniref:Uncharacterized protein n=1 Tax=Prorocentrum cordatum TaxID=2364126 RepID=A0ABN9TUT3_9DINO|nr:unnamed protein product [Polarella glacialis]